MALNQKEKDRTNELVEKYGYSNVIYALEDSMSGKWEVAYLLEAHAWIVVTKHIENGEFYTVSDDMACDCEKGVRGLNCIHQVLVELEKEKEG